MKDFQVFHKYAFEKAIDEVRERRDNPKMVMHPKTPNNWGQLTVNEKIEWINKNVEVD